jgi:hypothetical protein
VEALSTGGDVNGIDISRITLSRMHSYSSYLQQFAIYAGGTTLSSSFLENIHLHLWLLKDLSWAQDWYYAGLFFGSLAVAFSFLLFCSALISRATNEIFFSAAVFVW